MYSKKYHIIYLQFFNLIWESIPSLANNNNDDDLQVGALTAVQEKRGPGHTRDSARMQLLKILSIDKYILIYGKDNVTCFSHYGKLQFLQKNK